MIGGVLFMTGHALLAVPNNLFIVYAALAFLVIGNGFFKPNVSSMVGNLYSEGSHLKDKAYLIFYMGINVGARWRRSWPDSSSRGGDSIRRSSWARSAWSSR